MERDNEVSGNGNSYTTEFRQYDPRLGRWKSLDPLMAKFPWVSPYVAFNNNSIFYTDPLGLESNIVIVGGNNGKERREVRRDIRNRMKVDKTFRDKIKEMRRESTVYKISKHDNPNSNHDLGELFEYKISKDEKRVQIKYSDNENRGQKKRIYDVTPTESTNHIGHISSNEQGGYANLDFNSKDINWRADANTDFISSRPNEVKVNKIIQSAPHLKVSDDIGNVKPGNNVGPAERFRLHASTDPLTLSYDGGLYLDHAAYSDYQSFGVQFYGYYEHIHLEVPLGLFNLPRWKKARLIKSIDGKAVWESIHRDYNLISNWLK